MTTHHHSTDDFAELAELMRDERESAERRAPAEARARRIRRRRGLIAVVTVMMLVLAAVGAYVVWALNAPLSAPSVTSQVPQVEPPAAAAIAVPPEGISAISIAGADDYFTADVSGGWAAGAADERRPIGSITKLITALVILEARPLASPDDPGPTLTFSESDNDLYDKYYVLGATTAEMPTGSSMSQYDALSTMLVPSASNYAEAVSTWAFGSQGAFLSATQTWLAANGLGGTTVVEPTGISAQNTSTVTDLLAIGKLAAANPVVAAIAATPSIALPGPGSLSNTNTLLGGEITGLKTGNLGEGTHNLLYTATVEVGADAPLSVTGVVLGGFSRDTVGQGVRALLDSIRAGFHEVVVANKGQDIGTYTTPWGATAQMVIAENASIFTWSDTPIEASMTPSATVTYDDGEQVGTIDWVAGPHTTSAAIEIEGEIEPPSAWWRLTHPSELG
ncbi:D-alanyl-D-alanine carboxypeptidase family protein [Marisediminicola sp. LYQ85]|uniref:D-alanyl-D-alanine carboxypeptidase family protein n=1 Tax=Marisediminicola sp. LYQ85 TaxID=3391062 RepID=UPI00398375D6